MKTFDQRKSTRGVESAIPFVALFFILFIPMILAIKWDIKYIFWAIPVGVFFMYFYYLRKFTYLKNMVLDSYSNIDVQLKRRHDLIFGLCEVIKKYKEYEKILIKKINSRNYGEVVALAEKYPVIKADRLFLELRDELGDCEDELAAARDIYNDNVRVFNSYLESFPGGIVGDMNGYRKFVFWVDELKKLIF